MNFDNKLAIIVNKEIEIGKAMNAVAHCSLSLGSIIGKDPLYIKNYNDASGNNWPISGMPYVVLRGKNNEIKKAITAAKEADILQIAFTETMIGGDSFEQEIERTAKLAQDEHLFYALLLFGPWDKVNQITKKFSLFKVEV